jgi:RNA polymerase sigma-70 factor (ECF subfamily)
MSQSSPGPDPLIARARAGDAEALGRLLESYRNYLRMLSRSLIGQTLRLRLDSSDLIQETFLEAHRDFPKFAGSGEPELAAWLRRILVRNLADQVRYHRAPRRDERLERSLEAMLERSGREASAALGANLSSPSAQAARRENAVLLADALAALPANYREVILLRNFDHLPFEQVAVRMGRSTGAVRMLWVRALEHLSRSLETLQ